MTHLFVYENNFDSVELFSCPTISKIPEILSQAIWNSRWGKSAVVVQYELSQEWGERNLKLTSRNATVWVSITGWRSGMQQAGTRPTRTERVAQRECQIVNLCVFHLYCDMILREFSSYHSTTGEFQFVAPVASATGTMVGTHTCRSTHTPTYICVM